MKTTEINKEFEQINDIIKNIDKLYEFKCSEWYESFYWNIISNPY